MNSPMKPLRLLPLFVLGLLTGVQAAPAASQPSTSRPSAPPASTGAVAAPRTTTVATAAQEGVQGRERNSTPVSAKVSTNDSARTSAREGASAAADVSALPGYAEVEWIRTPRPLAQGNRTDGTAQDSALDGLRQEASSEWTVELSDRTFRQTLLRWTRIANWQLVWEVDRDFAIDAQVTLNGNFLDALNQAMTSLRDTDYPVQARINPDTRVVRVVRYMLDGERR